MRYVLDASVALKWVLPEPDSAKARQLRGGFQAAVHELLAPDVFPVEVGHALTRAERRGIIAVGDADRHLLNILVTVPQLHPYIPLLRRAVAISSAARVGIYDCLYVALAEREGCRLVTADTRLVNNLRTQFPFIVELGAVP
jgi:predicted nucleic acid-binding protein